MIFAFDFILLPFSFLIELVHRRIQPFAQPYLDGVGRARERFVHQGSLVAGKIAEHMIHIGIWIRTTDANAQARKLGRADARDDGFHAVMPARAAFRTQAQIAEWLIQVVVHDKQIVRRDFVEREQFTNRIARQIHECLRFRNHHARFAHTALGKFGVEFFARER